MLTRKRNLFTAAAAVATLATAGGIAAFELLAATARPPRPAAVQPAPASVAALPAAEGGDR